MTFPKIMPCLLYYCHDLQPILISCIFIIPLIVQYLNIWLKKMVAETLKKPSQILVKDLDSFTIWFSHVKVSWKHYLCITASADSWCGLQPAAPKCKMFCSSVARWDLMRITTSHHSVETPANHSCSSLKFYKYCFYFILQKKLYLNTSSVKRE